MFRAYLKSNFSSTPAHPQRDAQNKALNWRVPLRRLRASRRPRLWSRRAARVVSARGKNTTMYFVSTDDEITGIFDSVSARTKLDEKDGLSRELWSVRSISSSVLPKATKKKDRRHVKRRSTIESPDDVISTESELMATSTFSGTNDATALDKKRLGSDIEVVAESPVRLHSSGTTGGASGCLFLSREGFSHDKPANVEKLQSSSQALGDSSRAAARVEPIRLSTHNDFGSDDDDLVVRRRGGGIKVAHRAAKNRTGDLLPSSAITDARRRLNGTIGFLMPPLDVDVEQTVTTTTACFNALAPPPD